MSDPTVNLASNSKENDQILEFKKIINQINIIKNKIN